MLKKILISLLAIFGLLAVAFWGYFKFRQIKAEQNTMPRATEAIIKVDVDGLFASVIWSCLKHPQQYRNLQKGNFNNQIAIAKTGLKIPANLYLYKIKNGFYTRLKIGDSLNFKKFISTHYNFIVQKTQEKGLHIAQSSLLGIDLVFDAQHVAISYHSDKLSNLSVLKDFFSNKNQVSVTGSKFEEINSHRNHLTVASEENILALNFRDGAISFKDELLSDEIVPAAKPEHNTFAPDIPLTMWINADLKPAQSVSKQAKFSLFSTLKKSYSGYIDFQWLGTTSRTDTVITYTYNDDFQQTETKTLKKVQVPQVMINMKGNFSALRKSLLDSNRIDVQTGKFDTETIPLSNAYLTGLNNNIQISGSKTFDGRYLQKLPSDNFFEADLDVEWLLEHTDFLPETAKQLQIKKIVASGRSFSKGKIAIDGAVRFKNENLNSILLLLNILKKTDKMNLNLKTKLP